MKAARRLARVSGFFAARGRAEPGVVQVPQWRPGPAGPLSSHALAIYGGVGRKP